MLCRYLPTRFFHRTVFFVSSRLGCRGPGCWLDASHPPSGGVGPAEYKMVHVKKNKKINCFNMLKNCGYMMRVIQHIQPKPFLRDTNRVTHSTYIKLCICMYTARQETINKSGDAGHHIGNINIYEYMCMRRCTCICLCK